MHTNDTSCVLESIARVVNILTFQAFAALVQNALQVAVINSTGDFVLFLAKCITAAFTGLIALTVFRTNDTLHFYAIPVLLTVVFSYFVAHCVISVFEVRVVILETGVP